jgi:hypothetical protein
VFVWASHEGARHCVDGPGTSQASRFWPSQVPSHPDLSPGQAARGETGVPVTAEQVPTEPASAQASHWPLQAKLQHTPSVQNVD